MKLIKTLIAVVFAIALIGSSPVWVQSPLCQYE